MQIPLRAAESLLGAQACKRVEFGMGFDMSDAVEHVQVDVYVNFELIDTGQ